VIAWHGASRVNLPPWAMGPFKPLISVGWAGVDLFFALSGFLITTLLLREEHSDPARRFSLGAFYVRRALRILPPFYVVLALNIFVLSASPFFSSARLPRFPPAALETLSLATFWSNYFYSYAGVTVASPAYQVLWSLCVEEHFYLLWPFALTLLRGRRARVFAAGAACVLLCVLRYVAAREHFDPPAVIHILSHYRIDSILWGALGAIAFDALRLRRGTLRLALAACTTATVALFLTGELGTNPTPFGHSVGLSLLAATATLLVAEAAAGPSPLGRALEVRPLRAIGRVSYGMYLLHFQAIDVGARLVIPRVKEPSVAVFALLYALFVVLAFASAWVMYRLIERPFLDLRGRFRSHRSHEDPAPAGP
jgi:peptidoglycan/LPS O-acetylase OafA/YrhL